MDGIEVKQIRVLRGANIWAYRPVMEALLDIGRYEELPSNKLPGFTERLVRAMPSLWEHRCSEGIRGGFLERLRLGTYMGHILEHVILALQSLAGLDTGFGRTRGAGQEGQYWLVFDYKDEKAARMCLDLGIEMLETFARDEPLQFDLDEKIRQIRDIAEENMPGPSTQAILSAAKRRRIPSFRLDDGVLYQLGHGRFARRIMASETSLTPSIAVEIASDKQLTKSLLEKVAVPVPDGRVVSSASEAWEAAVDLGFPVVVKPFDGNQGKGVSVGLRTEEEVRRAYEIVGELGRKALVERFVPGKDYRLLVINGKMVAASERRPAQVVADGLHSIRQLVEMVNMDPRRGSGHGAALTRIKTDSAAELTLRKQGLTWESIPPAGTIANLRDNSNISTGGTAVDVTSDVHPDNARMAVLAALAVGLDVAGIDVVCENIRVPLSEQSGGVVEVNAAPGLRMHLYPSEGKLQPVAEALVDMLFPEGSQARVPLIAVTGTNGKTTVTRMIANVYHAMGKFVGMTTTDGIYFNGVRSEKSDASGPRSAEAVLQHPLVEVAVLETARGGILRSGLAWDRSTVSIVLNIASDHLGLGGVNTLDKLARVKRVIVESVSKDGYAVLNAEDERVARMASHCPGKVIFFAMDRSNPVVTSHLASGGKAAFYNAGQLVLAEPLEEIPLMQASDIPATHGGLIPFQIQNALAAAAACWGAGVPLASIKLGLRTFQSDADMAPGRFNVFDVGEVRAIVDYGHNPHALKAVQGAIADDEAQAGYRRDNLPRRPARRRYARVGLCGRRNVRLDHNQGRRRPART